MIGYVTIGVNDMERAMAFYDALFGEIGGSMLMGTDRTKLYGTSPTSAMFGLTTTWDGKPAFPGNGNMVAIHGGSREGVDKLYAKAIELGGADEGEPGLRGGGPFYGAYVRDLEGNKLCFYLLEQS